jgi:hypothetical protein
LWLLGSARIELEEKEKAKEFPSVAATNYPSLSNGGKGRALEALRSD